MEQKKRVWLYCRILKEERERLQWQQACLKQLSANNGFQVVGCSFDVGRDLTPASPGVAELRRAADTGQIDLVLILDNSHSYRDIIQTTQMIAELNEQGVAFFSPVTGEIKNGSYLEILTGLAKLNQMVGEMKIG